MQSTNGGLGARLTANYRLIGSLCDRLERIADTLPNAIDRQECLVLSRTLGARLSEAQALEEAELHPVIAAGGTWRIEIGSTLDRLRIEHQMDQFYAEEVQEMLRAFGEGRPNMSADAAGFLLRGFFESLRRHIAFEESLLMPLVARSEAEAPLAAVSRNSAGAGQGRAR